jgi:hypothetical protein
MLAGFLLVASPFPGRASQGTGPAPAGDTRDPLKGVLHFLATQPGAEPSHAHRTTAAVRARTPSRSAPIRVARAAYPDPRDSIPGAGLPLSGYARYASPRYGYAAAPYPVYAYRPYAYPPYPYYAYYPYRPYPVYRYVYRYAYPPGYPVY